MRLRILFIVAGLSIIPLAQAQHLSPSVISPSGDVSYSTDFSLEWTLGEIAVNTIHATDHIYTEGFHQPVLSVRVVEAPFNYNTTEYAENIASGDLKITVVPNPVTSILHVTIISNDPSEILLQLSDLSGKTVISTEVDPMVNSTDLDVSFLPSGLYLLQFIDGEGKMIKTYKVAKIQ